MRASLTFAEGDLERLVAKAVRKRRGLADDVEVVVAITSEYASDKPGTFQKCLTSATASWDAEYEEKRDG